MSTDPSHTVWEDEEAAREAALAEGGLADDEDGDGLADEDETA